MTYHIPGHLKDTIILEIEKILVCKDSFFCWIKCKPISTKQLVKDLKLLMDFYAVFLLFGFFCIKGVFKTTFGIKPLKIKPECILNIYFIKQNTKAKENIYQLLS